MISVDEFISATREFTNAKNLQLKIHEIDHTQLNIGIEDGNQWFWVNIKKEGNNVQNPLELHIKSRNYKEYLQYIKEKLGLDYQ